MVGKHVQWMKCVLWRKKRKIINLRRNDRLYILFVGDRWGKEKAKEIKKVGEYKRKKKKEMFKVLPVSREKSNVKVCVCLDKHRIWMERYSARISVQIITENIHIDKISRVCIIYWVQKVSSLVDRAETTLTVCRRIRSPPPPNKRGVLGRLLNCIWWSCATFEDVGERRVHFHCNYSQVNSDL